MTQIGKSAELPLEPVQLIGIEDAQAFESHDLVPLPVECFIYFSKLARAELPLDPESLSARKHGASQFIASQIIPPALWPGDRFLQKIACSQMLEEQTTNLRFQFAVGPARLFNVRSDIRSRPLQSSAEYD